MINKKHQEALGQFERYIRAERGLSPRTVEAYVHHAQVFLEYLAGRGVTDFAQVDRTVLRGHIAALHEAGHEKTGVALKLSSIRALFRFLVQRGMAPRNPLWTKRSNEARALSPKLDQRLPSFLNQEEVDRLLQAPDTTDIFGLRDKAILELVYAAGLR